jgi:hypothetical protein
MDKHIEILESIEGFQVRVMSTDGRTIRRFTYRTVEDARKAASAWRVAHNGCEVRDMTRRATDRETPHE